MADNINTERGAAVVSDGAGRTGVVEYWRPVIWSAVIGGMVAALGVQLILTLLGMGIGAAMVNPWSDPGTDADAIGVTAALFTIISGVISFGVGGYIAGHMSGVLRTGSGAIHGMLAWAAAAVFGVAMAAVAGSATLGGAASGAGGAVGGAAAAWRSDARIVEPGRGGDELTTERSREEIAAAAERAAEAASRVALITGIAFLLSMISAGVGGTLGRTGLRAATHQGGPRARPHMA